MRYSMWFGFAIVAIAYTVVATILRNRQMNDALIERMRPWREAFRDRYVLEEFSDG